MAHSGRPLPKFSADKAGTSGGLFLELGVGYNTPGIIKYPFWQMTEQNPMLFIAASMMDIRLVQAISSSNLFVLIKNRNCFG